MNVVASAAGRASDGNLRPEIVERRRTHPVGESAGDYD